MKPSVPHLLITPHYIRKTGKLEVSVSLELNLMRYRSRTCWLEPACIVTPDTDTEVSQIMTILSVFRTKFAVRSGGHFEAPGFNGVGGDGVLVALSNLKKLALSNDRKVLTLGPGQRWGPVYDFVNPYNVTVLGGRQPMVGVGGLLLGGGLSLFYNTYGISLSRVSRYHVS